MSVRDRILSVAVDRGSRDRMRSAILERAVSRAPGHVCFANVHMLHQASRRPEVAAALASSFLVAPDGMPLAVFLSRVGARQERIEGMSMFPALLADAAREGVAVALFGSDSWTLEAVRVKAALEFPGLRIVESISPTHAELPFSDDSESVRRLAASGAGLVFVALGCPKQELWMAANSASIPAVVLGIGNALRTWLGWEKRAPLWMRGLCLEWLARLAQDPGRLWRRYLVSNSWFLAKAAREIVSGRRSRR